MTPADFYTMNTDSFLKPGHWYVHKNNLNSLFFVVSYNPLRTDGSPAPTIDSNTYSIVYVEIRASLPLQYGRVKQYLLPNESISDYIEVELSKIEYRIADGS